MRSGYGTRAAAWLRQQHAEGGALCGRRAIVYPLIALFQVVARRRRLLSLQCSHSCAKSLSWPVGTARASNRRPKAAAAAKPGVPRCGDVKGP